MSIQRVGVSFSTEGLSRREQVTLALMVTLAAAGIALFVANYIVKGSLPVPTHLAWIYPAGCVGGVFAVFYRRMSDAEVSKVFQCAIERGANHYAQRLLPRMQRRGPRSRPLKDYLQDAARYNNALMVKVLLPYTNPNPGFQGAIQDMSDGEVLRLFKCITTTENPMSLSLGTRLENAVRNGNMSLVQSLLSDQEITSDILCRTACQAVLNDKVRLVKALAPHITDRNDLWTLLRTAMLCRRDAIVDALVQAKETTVWNEDAQIQAKETTRWNKDVTIWATSFGYTQIALRFLDKVKKRTMPAVLKRAVENRRYEIVARIMQHPENLSFLRSIQPRDVAFSDKYRQYDATFDHAWYSALDYAWHIACSYRDLRLMELLIPAADKLSDKQWDATFQHWPELRHCVVSAEASRAEAFASWKVAISSAS